MNEDLIKLQNSHSGREKSEFRVEEDLIFFLEIVSLAKEIGQSQERPQSSSKQSVSPRNIISAKTYQKTPECKKTPVSF